MWMMRVILLFVLMWITGQNTYGQALQDFDYIDYTYVPHIRSVQFKGTQKQTSNFPVVQLNRGNLFFSFDDLTEQQLEYTYRVIHCDRNWKPTNLPVEEYVDGFDYEEIRNAAFSRNTYTDYVHYELQIPNRRYQWLISGNYLLVVYEGDRNNGVPVITRRFMVAEQTVDVGIQVKRPIKVSKLNTHQEFDFFVNYEEFPIGNPLQEITATVLQNGRWSTAIADLKPNFISNYRMNFNFQDRVIFPAGKEFRNFDIRSLEYTSRWVHSIDLKPFGTDVILRMQRSRKNQNYTFLPDLNGSFFITNNDNDFQYNRDADVTADYANVVFALEIEPIEDDREIYAIGSFSGWQPLPEYKLEYDPVNEIYTNQELFKQGYYDYIYAVLGNDGLDSEQLEGNNYQTVNNYQILIYYRDFSGRYDRLIAAKTFEFTY
jgi:hypothetical protein